MYCSTAIVIYYVIKHVKCEDVSRLENKKYHSTNKVKLTRAVVVAATDQWCFIIDFCRLNLLVTK